MDTAQITKPDGVVENIFVDFKCNKYIRKCTFNVEYSYLNDNKKIISYECKKDKKTRCISTHGNITVHYLQKGNKLEISGACSTLKLYNIQIKSDTDISLKNINISGYLDINSDKLSAADVNYNEFLTTNRNPTNILIMDNIKTGSYIIVNSRDITNYYTESGGNIDIKAKKFNNNYGKIIGGKVNIDSTDIDNNYGFIDGKENVSIKCATKLENMLGTIQSSGGTVDITITRIEYNSGIHNKSGILKSKGDMIITIKYDPEKDPDKYNYNYSMENQGGVIQSLSTIKISATRIENKYGTIDGKVITLSSYYVDNTNGFVSKSPNISILKNGTCKGITVKGFKEELHY
jgi:adhesin HecA-like repeat protein